MIHAELTSMVIEAGGGAALQNYAETYEGEDDFMMIWTYYETYKPYVKNVNPGWQHELMADHYIQYMAEGLKTLHPSMSSQPFIDYWNDSGFYLNNGSKWIDWDWDRFFNAMAWEGLESSNESGTTYLIDAWEKLSQAEKDLINNYQMQNNDSNKCN